MQHFGGRAAPVLRGPAHPRPTRSRRTLAGCGIVAALALAPAACTTGESAARSGDSAAASVRPAAATIPPTDSGHPLAARSDSVAPAAAPVVRRKLTAAEARAIAERADGFRVVVSLAERQLWAIDDDDTLRVAPVGIGMDSTLRYRGRVWRFQTPRGVRRVRGKETDPRWIPPDWHYVEVARSRGLELVHLPPDRPVTLDDGSQIVVEGDEVGLVTADSGFRPFMHDEEVIWDGTLYVPPIGTRQRAITGELGRFRLDLGDGYLLHGTPHTESIGEPSSHGCIRLRDEDIEWLYENVPVGTRVYTY
jgi:lipoprotein-anchoring transpeptidase ErfK/SrfK